MSRPSRRHRHVVTQAGRLTPTEAQREAMTGMRRAWESLRAASPDEETPVGHIWFTGLWMIHRYLVSIEAMYVRGDDAA